MIESYPLGINYSLEKCILNQSGKSFSTKFLDDKINNTKKNISTEVPPIISEVNISIINNSKNEDPNEKEKSIEALSIPNITDQENKPNAKEDIHIDIEDDLNKYHTSEATTAPDIKTVNIEILDSNKYYCSICFMEYEINSMITLQYCNHKFCRECIIQYIENLITTGRYNINCPLENCKMPFHEDELKLLIMPERYTNFIKWREVQRIESDPTMRVCPKENCGKTIHLYPGSNYGICECGLELCFKCGELRHANRTCEEVIAIVFQNSNINGPIKLCPKCSSKSIKEEGCNQVVCSKCYFHYCWNCLSEWNRGHTCRNTFPRHHWIIIVIMVILSPIGFIFSLIWVWIAAVVYAFFLHIFFIVALPVIIIICIDRSLRNRSKFRRALAILIEIPLIPVLLVGYIFISLCVCNIFTNLIKDINNTSNKVIMKCIPRLWSLPEDGRRPELLLGFFFSIVVYLVIIFNIYAMKTRAENDD